MMMMMMMMMMIPSVFQVATVFSGPSAGLAPMSSSGAAGGSDGGAAGEDRVQNHGVALTQGMNKRVRCNYCAKEVGGFNRLQHHLGHVGPDVTPCLQAPLDVKERMRSALLERRKGKLVREVGKVLHPHLPLRRNFVPANPETTNSAQLQQPSSVQLLSTNSAEAEDASKSLATECVARFFYESAESSGIKQTSFRAMINAVISCGAGYEPPTHDQVMGRLLGKEVARVKERIDNIKRSWQRTGCSILFDSWTDRKGRFLMRFLADSPQGTIFLKSVDASRLFDDADALFLLFSGVVDEVGPENVVQIMAPDTSVPYMEATKAMLVDKYTTLFWTTCADACIDMILENIGTDDGAVEKTLNQAKAITRLIYGHEQTLELMEEHIRGGGLVQSSHLKSVAQFITLRKIVSERDNLRRMFRSRKWKASVLSSQALGKTASDLVKSSYFWKAAEDVLKITDPLIDVLHKINGGTAAPMGVIYDTMDRAKLKIRKNFDDVEQKFTPYWDMIDATWNNDLHNPIHTAGYYLNPDIFYSPGVCVDKEVTTGLLLCIVRLVADKHAQELIVHQLDEYRDSKAGFSDPMATSTDSPVLWWSRHAERTPELQSVAVKVLSQPCTSASRYRLRKGLSEKLHVEGKDNTEQKRLIDLELVHNNLNLWNSSKMNWWDSTTSIEDIEPLNDWTVDISCRPDGLLP